MSLDARLLEILACPQDKGPLYYFAAEGLLYNPRLKRKYRVDDGVPNLLIDEASTAELAEHERLLAKAKASNVTLNF